MSFFDFADLPRSHVLLDSSRKYRGLSYNCSHVAQVPAYRSPPFQLNPAKSRDPSTPRAKPTMPVTLETFTAFDIPAAIAVYSSLNNDSPEARSRVEHEWNLALVNPYARIVKATKDGQLIGAAGFLTHETNGLQWTSSERKAWAGSSEKELEERLEGAREDVLHGDYDLWHIYLSFIAPGHQDTAAWGDMISWGLALADEAEKRVYVQSSAFEKAMYENLGFKTKTVVTLPDGEKYLMLRRV